MKGLLIFVNIWEGGGFKKLNRIIDRGGSIVCKFVNIVLSVLVFFF